MSEYSGMFKKWYGPLHGYDWVKHLEREALKIFVDVGNEHNQHGRLGGIARAQTALRDERGRFTRNNPLTWIQYG